MLVLIRAQSCCLEEHQKSEMTRGRHGDHVSVMVLGNPQNCFFNRSIGNFDGLVCTPILSDASVFLEDRTQITSEQVAQQLLADPMARFFSGLLRSTARWRRMRRASAQPRRKPAGKLFGGSRPAHGACSFNASFKDSQRRPPSTA